MLYLTRRQHDALEIDISDFARGHTNPCIRLLVESVSSSGVVRLGIEAAPELRIYRPELLAQPHTPAPPRHPERVVRRRTRGLPVKRRPQREP